jgi:sugar lactone lactonase YvrE
MKKYTRAFLVSALFFSACSKEVSFEDGRVPPPAYHVSLLAGTGVAGFSDGAATESQFRVPKGIAIDAAGNIYVGDSGNNRIRRLSANTVTTLAGKGQAGFANGNGTTAMFRSPVDAAVDATGNVYVSDLNNHSIRKIAPDGNVTSVAGGPSAGFADGSRTEAQFNHPRGIVVDRGGNIFVVDMANHSIRKISPAGIVTTFAGDGRRGFRDGDATQARFTNPRGLTIDREGNLYVADTGNNAIRKISTTGQVTTVAGIAAAGYRDGLRAAARFYEPRGVAVDKNGNIYVGDTGNNRIRKINPEGEVITIAGDGRATLANGTGTDASFNMPRALVLDNEDRNLYVIDQLNNCVRKISLM